MKTHSIWGGLGLFGETAGGETEPSSATPATDTGAEAVPAAGEQTDPTARKEAFRNLMEGEYKDLFTAYFQETFNRRFREQKGMKEELEQARAVLAAVAERYGTRDTEQLLSAIRTEQSKTASTAAAAVEMPVSEAHIPDDGARIAAEQDIVATIRARGLRPAEGALALTGQGAPAPVAARLTRRERAEVARRAAHGEYIEF